MIDSRMSMIFLLRDVLCTSYTKMSKKQERKIREFSSPAFCMDDPEMIVAIIEQYPEFRAYYEQIYDICRNIEGVMDMFSKELQELDRNTVQLMIDEMQEDLKQKGKELNLINQELDKKNQQLDEKSQELDEKSKLIRWKVGL